VLGGKTRYGTDTWGKRKGVGKGTGLVIPKTLKRGGGGEKGVLLQFKQTPPKHGWNWERGSRESKGAASRKGAGKGEKKGKRLCLRTRNQLRLGKGRSLLKITRKHNSGPRLSEPADNETPPARGREGENGHGSKPKHGKTGREGTHSSSAKYQTRRAEGGICKPSGWIAKRREDGASRKSVAGQKAKMGDCAR